eukprot:gene29425-35517_t
MNFPFDDHNDLQGWLNRFGFSEGFKTAITELAGNHVHNLLPLYDDLPAILEIAQNRGNGLRDYRAFEEAKLHTPLLAPEAQIGENIAILNTAHDVDADFFLVDLDHNGGMGDNMVIVGEGAQQGELFAGMVEHAFLLYEREPIGDISDLSTFGLANRSVVHVADGQHELTYRVAAQAHDAQGSAQYFRAEEVVLPYFDVTSPRRCLRLRQPEGAAPLSSIYPMACYFAAHRALFHLLEAFNAQFPGHDLRVVSACVCKATSPALADNPFVLCEEVMPDDFGVYAAVEDLLAAFSHWSFAASAARLLVLPSAAADGGVVEDEADAVFLADPVVHCADLLCYGRRNKGPAAFRGFFQGAHAQCNDYCRAWGVAAHRPVFAG